MEKEEETGLGTGNENGDRKAKRQRVALPETGSGYCQGQGQIHIQKKAERGLYLLKGSGLGGDAKGTIGVNFSAQPTVSVEKPVSLICGNSPSFPARYRRRRMLEWQPPHDLRWDVG